MEMEAQQLSIRSIPQGCCWKFCSRLTFGGGYFAMGDKIDFARGSNGAVQDGYQRSTRAFNCRSLNAALSSGHDVSRRFDFFGRSADGVIIFS